MIGKSRYLGLRGTKLNIAIGMIAGLDFLLVIIPQSLEINTDERRLFGYDQGVMGNFILADVWVLALILSGGLLTLPSFVRCSPNTCVV